MRAVAFVRKIKVLAIHLGTNATAPTVKGMTAKAKKEKRKAQKSGLNRSILDVGCGKIGQMLEWLDAAII